MRIQVPPPDENHNRITASIRTNHEEVGENPSSVECRFSSLVQPGDLLSVKINITENPFFPNTLPVGNIGYMLLENLVGTDYSKQPSQGDLNADSLRTIELKTSDEGDTLWIVRPTRFLFAECNEWENLRLVCANGTAKARLTVFPK
jgi:hypothetical protein